LSYHVTMTETVGSRQVGTVAHPGFTDHNAALIYACRLIKEGRQDVAISDGHRRIGGAELEACCAGIKQLTADLRAV
jgi:hypothetical protein